MTRRVAGALILLTVMSVLSGAYANGEVAGGVDHPHMWGYGGGWMISGPLMMIVVIAAIIALVVLPVRWLGGVPRGPHPTHLSPPRKAPLDILRERFSRGEIDKEEYEERRRLLSDQARREPWAARLSRYRGEAPAGSPISRANKPRDSGRKGTSFGLIYVKANADNSPYGNLERIMGVVS